MKKRILLCGAAIMMAAAMFALTACGGRSGEINENGDHVQVYSPKDAKQIGRTSYHADSKTLWCSLSGSGIDFLFYGKECSAELVGDSAWTSAGNNAHYAVYINGKQTHNAQLNEASRTVIIANPGKAEDPCEVRIVKLSESAQSSLGIGDLTITTPEAVYKNHKDATLKPAENKTHLIEFIGDSITCGYGVDGDPDKDKFTTSTEDCTKAYACVTAEKLDADYSLVSYSGHGILSGYTSTGKQNKSDLVPSYYDLVGHSFATLSDGTKIQDDKWDFSKKPDLVVVNLGTNDSSYTASDNAKMREFASAYVEFLKQIREKNPDAPIICVLGTMGTTLCDAVDLAVMDYKKETGDENIRFMRLTSQDPTADGIGIDWHPSAKTHEKTAEKLVALIQDWLKW